MQQIAKEPLQSGQAMDTVAISCPVLLQELQTMQAEDSAVEIKSVFQLCHNFNKVGDGTR